MSRLAWFVLMLSWTLNVVWAQGSSVGNITGSVTDPSGSAIPGATVAIRNINTNQTRETRTGDAGLYTVTTLPVGDYRLTATAPGFKRVEVTDIKLDVNATLRVDVAMTVGQVTETVEVAAQAPLLNTENASTGQVIEAKRVTELPLNGRDFQQLQLLSSWQYLRHKFPDRPRPKRRRQFADNYGNDECV